MNATASVLAAGALLATLGLLPQDRQAVNLDFEAGRGGADTAAAGWRTSGDGYAFALDSSVRHAGRYSMRTRRVGTGGFGLVSQTVAATGHAGGTVRISGFVRTEGVAEGYAGLWARVDGVRSGLAMDNMSDRGATGATPWTRYEIELPVEDCATHVVFGPIHSGSGTAWYDDLAIEWRPATRGGTPAADCSPSSQEYNLDFERTLSQATRIPDGWSPASGGPVAVDSAVRYSGRYSVRLDGDSSEATTLIREIPVRRVAGRRVAVRGYARSVGDASGTSIVLRVLGADSTTTYRSETVSPVAGAAPWAELNVAATVDRCANTLWVGIENSQADTVWFDRLSLSVDGNALPAAPPARSPADIPGTDRERLLSDRELAVAPDDCAPPENATWTAWAAAHAVPVRSITSGDFADLQFLEDVLADKRIVQLGESGHGVEPFNMAKTRLIRFLHEEMGFDVIAFESSLEECYHANRLIEESTADELMRNCIFGVWHTDEVVQLFEYIKATAATSRPLVLAGFDTQTSSRLASSRPARLRELIAHVDPERASQVEEMDAKALARIRARADESLPPLATVRDSIIALYEELQLYLEDRADEIAAQGVDPRDVAVAARGAQSMIHFLLQLTAPGMERTVARDSGMADNLDFLVNVLYPEEKVITWGHNFHLRHLNQETSPAGVKTMGAWVAERHRDEMYTVGLYMYRGEAALNNRQVYDVFRPTPGSLESTLHRTGLKYQFVDLSRAVREPGSEWIFTPIPAKTWGRSDVTMVLRDQYDGILFIDTVWSPAYR